MTEHGKDKSDEVTGDAVLRALDGVTDPQTGLGLAASGLVQGLAVREGHVSFVLDMPPQRATQAEPMRQAAEAAVAALHGVARVTAVLTAHREGPGDAPTPRGVHVSPTAAPRRPRSATAVSLPGVGAVIAVASGKGGVGKSTVAVNLAAALARSGLKVGLLDADVYGPSVPRMLGITGAPEPAGGRLKPMEAHGLKAMSIGFLVDPDTALIWRGPMVMSALTQMLNDVDWGELDILVVDMPPGTGDAQLTMAQRVPLKGAIIVSTPQEIALADARKGLAMFRKTQVPVLGIVENMSWFLNPGTGERTHIFGEGGARRLAETMGVPLLGEIPLDITIRETSDDGRPIAASAPESDPARIFAALAEAVRARLRDVTTRPAPRIRIT